jgi:hypothetical protein
VLHGVDDIGHAGAADDQRGVLVDGAVPDPTEDVVVRIVGTQDAAAKRSLVELKVFGYRHALSVSQASGREGDQADRLNLPG